MEWLGPALGAFGIISMVVAAVYVGRSHAKDQTITALQANLNSFVSGNDELRTQMAEREQHCAEQIAQLRGRVDLLSEQQSEVLAGLLGPRIADALIEAHHQGRWRVP